jgi:type VI secretion system protein ImpM
MMQEKGLPTIGAEGPVTVQAILSPILSPIAGWYGKLPCLGDFASRRLPPEFIEMWDEWLQRSIAASRQQLGEGWLELFLKSPMWRFALTPGVCGSYAWAGLLVPSVDRVGRYFPLTLVVPIEASDGNLAHVFAAESWYAELEKIGLAALNVDFDPEQLEAALARNPFPPSRGASPQDGVAREMAAWIAGGSQPRGFLFSGGDSIGEVMDDASQALYAASAAGRTFWWAVSDTSAATEAHGTVGMPPADYYAVLLGASREGEADDLPSDPLKAFGFENAADGPEPLR